MSLTITPAFRIFQNADLFEVAEGLRDVLRPYLSKRFHKEAVSMAVREYDSVENINAGVSFSKFLQQSNKRLTQNLSSTGEKDLDKYDLLPFRRVRDFQGIFLRNKLRDETYLLFGQDVLSKDGEELVLEVKGIDSDFSYWNGSDSQINGSHPDITIITEEEWLHRGVCWKETLNFSQGISQQGIVVKFFESLSTYGLLNWKSYEEQADTLISMSAPEERFRRLVFNTYLENLRKVYPDLDIMDIINRSWRFLNPNKDREYHKLPFAKEQEIRLEKAVLFAEKRVVEFPLVF